ncbi:alpha/beta fold hydrolase [Streptomyces sp. NPDC054796]
MTAVAPPAYFDAYDAVLRRWPAGTETVEVPSLYGTTRVNVLGPREARPLVLLHGGGATSTVWAANVAALSRTHRVCAVDLIGDPGRSTLAPGQRLTGVGDLMAWLDGVLDHFAPGEGESEGGQAVQADLCGHSYGAWIALTYALHATGRVRRLALLDPTQCFASFSPRYLLRALPLLLRPTAARARGLVDWETGGAALDPDWLELYARGTSDFPSARPVTGPRPSAARLRGLTAPLLVLLAGESRAHDVRRVAAGARRAVPGAVVETLPGVSHHALPLHAPASARLDERLTDFFGDDGR